MLYAGIGRRFASQAALKLACDFALEMQKRGYTLRSGGAAGFDSAFERGAGIKKEIILPQEATKQAIVQAAQFHPAWKNCSDFARNAHGRNVMIILGRNMDTPVKFVAYLKKDSELKVLDGGTGVALRIAEYYNIPTICLNDGTHNNITIPSIINNLTRPW